MGDELARLRPLTAASCLGVRDGATVRQWAVSRADCLILPLFFPWCGFLGVFLVGCVAVVLNEGGSNKTTSSTLAVNGALPFI